MRHDRLYRLGLSSKEEGEEEGRRKRRAEQVSVDTSFDSNWNGSLLFILVIIIILMFTDESHLIVMTNKYQIRPKCCSICHIMGALQKLSLQEP